MMDILFHWLGVATFTVILIMTWWYIVSWFIWPALIATSLVRCFIAVQSEHGHPLGVKPILKQWWIEYKGHLIIGQTYTKISNSQFTWYGVGRWHVYKRDEHE